MRAYRVSILSDDALRQLHESAQRTVKQRRDEGIEVFRQALAEREVRVSNCEAHINDAAYRARNPGECERRYGGSAEDAYRAAMRGIYVRTVDEEFEDLIFSLWRLCFSSAKPRARVVCRHRLRSRPPIR